MTNQGFLDSLKVGDRVALVSRIGSKPRCDSIGEVTAITKSRRITVATTELAGWHHNFRNAVDYTYTSDGRGWGRHRTWLSLEPITPEYQAQYDEYERERIRDVRAKRLANDLRETRWQDQAPETLEAVAAILEAAKAKAVKP